MCDKNGERLRNPVGIFFSIKIYQPVFLLFSLSACINLPPPPSPTSLLPIVLQAPNPMISMAHGPPSICLRPSTLNAGVQLSAVPLGIWWLCPSVPPRMRPLGATSWPWEDLGASSSSCSLIPGAQVGKQDLLSTNGSSYLFATLFLACGMWNARGSLRYVFKVQKAQSERSWQINDSD